MFNLAENTSFASSALFLTMLLSAAAILPAVSCMPVEEMATEQVELEEAEEAITDRRNCHRFARTQFAARYPVPIGKQFLSHRASFAPVSERDQLNGLGTHLRT